MTILTNTASSAPQRPAHPAPQRGRQRTIAAVVILAAWVAGVGMLVRREFFRESALILHAIQAELRG